jgi:methyltransferase (TIGR00027 family)
MKKGKSSKTAEQMAISRAIETMKPENERVCYDPYAIQFLSKKYSLPLKFKFFRNSITRFIELMFIGHHYYVIARTRFIDDVLASSVGAGIRQLIIMGAGFDSRAYRLRQLENIRVYEIDHPDTQNRKKERIKELSGNLPKHVIFIPLDFNTENFMEKLIRSGYDKNATSLFIWEGTTPYLTEHSVDETLTSISKYSCKGGCIVFDYILKSVIDETCNFDGALREHRYMKKTTEPLIFGLEKERMGSFLKKRGYSIVMDVNSDYFHNKYFSEKQDKIKIKPWWRIVQARIEG